MASNEAKWEESNVANRRSNDRAFENQRTLQGFCCGCEGKIYGNDRESPGMRTFECRALKMGIFRGLEDRNVAKIRNAKNLVALARGKPQDWQDRPRLVPPAIPPASANGKKR